VLGSLVLGGVVESTDSCFVVASLISLIDPSTSNRTPKKSSARPKVNKRTENKATRIILQFSCLV
jgi:hypothetical protein